MTLKWDVSPKMMMPVAFADGQLLAQECHQGRIRRAANG